MFVLHSKPLFMFVKHLSSHSVFFKIIYLSITIRSISWNESISPASSAYDAFSDTTRHRSAIDHYFSRHGAEDPEGPHGEVVRWGRGERWLHQRDAIILGIPTQHTPPAGCSRQHYGFRLSPHRALHATASAATGAPTAFDGGGHTRGHGDAGAAAVLLGVAGVGRGVHQGGAG